MVSVGTDLGAIAVSTLAADRAGAGSGMCCVVAQKMSQGRGLIVEVDDDRAIGTSTIARAAEVDQDPLLSKGALGIETGCAHTTGC